MGYFVKDVPQVYISDPSQLRVGMVLWEVGQGGRTSVCLPAVLGLYHHTGEDGMMIFTDVNGKKNHSTCHIGDKHLMPQQYNNWYLCRSRQDAMLIHEHIQNAWIHDPAFVEDVNAFKNYTRKRFGW